MNQFPQTAIGLKSTLDLLDDNSLPVVLMDTDGCIAVRCSRCLSSGAGGRGRNGRMRVMRKGVRDVAAHHARGTVHIQRLDGLGVSKRLADQSFNKPSWKRAYHADAYDTES